MNILVISQHYYPENFRITDIAETLASQGHKVTVVCGYPNYPEGFIPDEYKGKNGKKHKNEVINGVNVIRCFEIPRGHSSIKLFLNYYSVCLSMLFKTKKLKEKFDCVFINETSPIMVAWAGIAYAKKHKVPSIMYCYDLWPDSLAAGGIKEGSLIYKYYFGVSKKIYQRVDHICCTSKNFIPYLHETFGIEESKLSYLPQYCEYLFNEVSTVEHEGYNFVFAGNIGKVQSVETIIKAAIELKDDKRIKFHIVGDGSNLESCKELAKGLDNVIFYGKRPLEEMPKFYSMADAMILTLSKNKAISKTLPGKVQSYMAAGKPIIAAIDGEGKMIIDEAHCGLTCNAEDFTALSNLIIEYFERPNFDFGINGRKFYNNYFVKDVFFNSLLKILLSGGNRNA